jgi:8-oxo-dGTP diphosphatase
LTPSELVGDSLTNAFAHAIVVPEVMDGDHMEMDAASIQLSGGALIRQPSFSAMTPVRHVVLAVMTVNGGYALQHRDDRPDVAWPGYWGLFGGSVDTGERPIEAIRREIDEELGLDVTGWRELWTFTHASPYVDDIYRCTAFVVDVGDLCPRHVLGEGQAAGVFRLDALPEPTVPVAAALLERYDETCRK